MNNRWSHPGPDADWTTRPESPLEGYDPSLAQTIVKAPSREPRSGSLTRSIWPVMAMFGLLWITAMFLSWPIWNQFRTGSPLVGPASASSFAASVSNLVGEWQGNFDGQPAHLVISSTGNDRMEGTMLVSYDDGSYLVKVVGEVSGDEVMIVEKSAVIPPTATGTWALGIERGSVTPSGEMRGTGSDGVGQVYTWSFVHLH